MRAAVVTLIIFLGFILQTTLFEYIELMGVKPNILILVVISYAILRGDVEATIVGFLTGLFIDFLYADGIGMNAFLFALLGFFCGKPFKDFFRENYVFPLVLVLIGMLGHEFIYYVFNFLLQGRTNFWHYAQRIIFPETVYTLLLCIPVYRLMYGINAKLEARERRIKSIF